MSRINKLLKFLDKIEEGFSFFMIMFATLLIFLDVVLRYFGASITWAGEGTRYIIVWLSFVGGSLCAKHGEHVGIDLLMQITPPAVTKFLLFFNQIISSMFLFVFVYYGWDLAISTMKTGQISTGIMMPMWIVYMGVPIGCFLMALRFLQRAFNTLKGDTDGLNTGVTEDGTVDVSRL